MISKEVSQLTEKRERIFTVTDEQIFKVRVFEHVSMLMCLMILVFSIIPFIYLTHSSHSHFTSIDPTRHAVMHTVSLLPYTR